MDKIIIEDLEVYAYHGVYDFEKRDGQQFLVSAVLYVDFNKSGETDNINDTVSYADVCEFMDRFLKENTFNLIEAAAENLVEAILDKFSGIHEIELEIKKPNAPVGLTFKNISVKIKRKWHRAFLSIGSNLGDKQKYLGMVPEAVRENRKCRLINVSDFIITEPVGDVVQDDFLNACVELETTMSPNEFLDFTQSIEAKAKRTHEIHWGPRTLDVDILMYDNLVCDDKSLVIPHPEMHKREFVLKPLSQIAPFAVHPLSGMRIVDMLNRLNEDKQLGNVDKKA